MFCKNCGQQINQNYRFCSNCGTIVETNNHNFEENNQKTLSKLNFSKGKKLVIIGLIAILFVLLGILIFLKNNRLNKRTIMMYIVGSNLESDSSIVTTDLNAINPQKIDLTNTNILIYTGGTKTWHNFIKNDENAIYILTENGFSKLKSYSKANMGNPNTLTEFLNFSYENYPAKKYDLIMYDHGGAIDGAIYDDFSGDNLSIEDFNIALKNSYFDTENKMQTVLFRTCLNGTLEIADIFKDYAKYLIASEEVTYGSGYSNVLSFLNDVKYSDDGITYGQKFISKYKKQMEEIDIWGNVNNTYSIVDLSKVSTVIEELNKFIKNIDLKKNYSNISKVRANSYQYGSDVVGFDMIDLYNFISRIGNQNLTNNLLNAINEAVVFNDSNMSTSHGLSIYFPYKGSSLVKSSYLNVYDKLKNFTNYYEFIRQFTMLQSEKSSFNLDVYKNEIKINNENEISIQLDKEQQENFATASYQLFMQDKEHPDYYQIVYVSDDAVLDSNGVLKANVENNLVKASDDTGDWLFLNIAKGHNENNANIFALGILEKNITDYNSMATSYLYFKENGEKYQFTNARIVSDNERINGTFVKINDYKSVTFLRSRYKIFDEYGKFLEDKNAWGHTPITEGYKFELSKIELTKATLDKNEKYYCVFYITDINNNSYYSNVVEVKN